MSSKQENEQEQEAEQRTEQETRPALENTVSNSSEDMVTLACPVCQKTFERPTEDDAFNAVKMHALPAHKVRLTRTDVGLAEKEEIEKPMRVRGRRREVAEVIASEYDNLLAILKMTKCPKPEAVCRLAEGFGFTQEGIYEAMKRSATPVDVMRLVLSLWSLHLDEMLHPEIARKLRVTKFPIRPGYEEPYEYDRFGFRKKPSEVGELLTGVGNLLRNVRPTDETGSNLLHELTYKMGQMEERMKNPPQPDNTGNDQVISGLQTQVSELTKKLDEEREKRLFDKIDGLTKEVQDVKNRAMSAESAYGVLNTTIVSVKELAKEYLEMGKIAMGFQPNPAKPPTRKKVELPEGVESPLEQLAREHPELVEEG